MKIVQNLVSPDRYWLKCPYSMTPTSITVHNTANNASARNEISYMRSNDTSTSFHYAADDIEIVQGLPLNRNGWHSGDGNGDGNRKSIGIEICYSLSGGAKFNKAEKNAAKLIAKLLKERGWGISRVKKHQDRSGKYCPHRTLDMGWSRFLNMVKAELSPANPPKPAPKPAPKKITYKPIPKKSIELIRNANLWNFNFTDWTKAKPVQTRKKGAVIENVVAIATNPVGAKYYMTDYSYNKGKIRATNGFNVNDTKDYVAPKPTPKPEPKPEPAPIPPVDENPNQDIDKRLTALEKLVKAITDWLDGLFKNWRK